MHLHETSGDANVVESVNNKAIDVTDEANNKAKTLRMGNVNGKKVYGGKKKENKVEEFQLANLASN